MSYLPLDLSTETRPQSRWFYQDSCSAWAAFSNKDDEVLEIALSHGKEGCFTDDNDYYCYLDKRLRVSTKDTKASPIIRGAWFWRGKLHGWQPYPELISEYLEAAFFEKRFSPATTELGVGSYFASINKDGRGFQCSSNDPNQKVPIVRGYCHRFVVNKTNSKVALDGENDIHDWTAPRAYPLSSLRPTSPKGRNLSSVNTSTSFSSIKPHSLQRYNANLPADGQNSSYINNQLVKEGLIYIKPIIGKWKARWLVLTNNAIYVFSTEKKEKQRVALNDVRSANICFTSKSKFKWNLVLLNATILTFRTNTLEIARSWVDAINHQCVNLRAMSRNPNKGLIWDFKDIPSCVQSYRASEPVTLKKSVLIKSDVLTVNQDPVDDPNRQFLGTPLLVQQTTPSPLQYPQIQQQRSVYAPSMADLSQLNQNQNLAFVYVHNMMQPMNPQTSARYLLKMNVLTTPQMNSLRSLQANTPSLTHANNPGLFFTNNPNIAPPNMNYQQIVGPYFPQVDGCPTQPQQQGYLNQDNFNNSFYAQNAAFYPPP